jgi:hypothetical protein
MYNINTQNIYNINKKGFIQDVIKKQKVIVLKKREVPWEVLRYLI